MTKRLYALLVLALSALSFTNSALAHIGWANQDLILDANSSTLNGDGSTTYSWQKGTVRSNWGWADATDSDWGDSHQMKHAKFEITNPGGAYVDITVKQGDVNFIPHGSTTATDAQLGLRPSFSLYAGSGPIIDSNNPLNNHNLVPHAVHDWHPSILPAAADYLGKEGLIQAFGDNFMCNNNGQCGTEVYTGYYAGGVNSIANEVSLQNIFLNPGWYAIAVGGSDDTGMPFFENVHIGFTNLEAPVTAESFGFHVDLTVRPVPVPSAIWFMGTGLLSLIGIRKRKLMA